MYCTGGPSIKRVAVLDVTDISHGNANGLGIVDFTFRSIPFDGGNNESSNRIFCYCWHNSLDATI